MPSRSPEFSMHAADRRGKMGGMGGKREQKKCVGVFGQTESSFRTKDVATYPVILCTM